MTGNRPKVIAMPGPKTSGPAKTVRPAQAAIDALPYNSGTWRVEGSMGLYVRRRAQSKSYFVQRKVAGRLIQRVIG